MTNYKLSFSDRGVKNNISGAKSFHFSKPVPKIQIPVKFVPLQEAVKLCSLLYQNKIHSSLEQIFLDPDNCVGQKREVIKELDRIRNLQLPLTGAQLISFPFKCPVPVKTNYHTLPDLGEMLFLYKLGQISKNISLITKRDFKIFIFEETDALSPVFNVSQKECRHFQAKLRSFVAAMDMDRQIKIKSLQQVVIFSQEKYDLQVLEEAKRIGKDIQNYKGKLQYILPTISLSLNTTNLSLIESQQFTNNLFLSEVNPESSSDLFKTAIHYLAFLNVHHSAHVRKTKYLQLTVTPNKGRIGIKPTLPNVALLPHHGVPVVSRYGKNIKFTIEYYSDVLHRYKNREIYEIRELDNTFLFYEIIR